MASWVLIAWCRPRKDWRKFYLSRADGGLDLSFPVADFREAKMMILQFGADVEVLGPEALSTAPRD